MTLSDVHLDKEDLNNQSIKTFDFTFFFIGFSSDFITSFTKMKDQVIKYAEKSMKRPFIARYNALTQSIDVLDSKDRVLRYAVNIRGELSRLISAIEKNT